MRRKEKEVGDRREIDGIIRGAMVCRVAMNDGVDPYIVPLCFGYDGGALFFHCAREGRKLDVLRRNPRVCFEFEGDVKVTRGDKPCRWGMRYRSVIGWGRAVIVDTPDAKRAALACIMAQYDRGAHDFAEEELARTVVIRVDIERMTGKASS